jgi:hypothetical protein
VVKSWPFCSGGAAVGTLSAILKDVALHLGMEREALIRSLLEK